jgi:hypothetical protein
MTYALIAIIASAAPVLGRDFKLACPKGTVQVGGPHSPQQRLTCARSNADGSFTYVGPYYSFYKGGAVEAVGQVEDGLRSGKWVFYDEKGALVGDTEFKRGDFHGRRVFYHPDGSVMSVALYVEGRLQRP